jgi:hypothetical protein
LEVGWGLRRMKNLRASAGLAGRGPLGCGGWFLEVELSFVITYK